jgi:hypothetical protein
LGDGTLDVTGVGVLATGVGVGVTAGVVGVADMAGVGVLVMPVAPTISLAGGIRICTSWFTETITRTILIFVDFPISTRLILRTWFFESTHTVNRVAVMPLDSMSARRAACWLGASLARPASTP